MAERSEERESWRQIPPSPPVTKTPEWEFLFHLLDFIRPSSMMAG